MRCGALILRSDAQRRVAKDAALIRDLARRATIRTRTIPQPREPPPRRSSSARICWQFLLALTNVRALGNRFVCGIVSALIRLDADG
jgi:hypothetical protein